MANQLFERFPQLVGCPHRPLGDFPTPVRPAEGIARRLGGGEVWIKCDDQSSRIYGGNKVRKLEFILADALERNYVGVWTVGAIGSHHALATALFASKLGLKVSVHHFGQPVTAHVRQVCLATAATGAELTLTGRSILPLVVLEHKLASRFGHSKGALYYIPGGGSSPLGCLGYVAAALELASQIERGELPRPDCLYVALGTAGTLVGLLVGLQLAEIDIPIMGVRVVDRILANRCKIRRLANRTMEWLRSVGVGDRLRFDPRAYRLDHSQFGPGYGHPTAASQEAVDLARGEAGLELENTYTGKAMASLLSHRALGSAAKQRLLFWNTASSRPLDELIPQGFTTRDLPRPYHFWFSNETVE